MDSTSGITLEEAENLDMDILPMRIAFGSEECIDLYDIKGQEFFNKIEKSKAFPKTSLPSLETAMQLVDKYQGEEVLFLTLSSEISSTFSILRTAFLSQPNVKVMDSRMSAPGMKILAQEVLSHKEESLDQIEKRIEKLIPRIKIYGIPSSLEYLYKGGRVRSIEFIGAKILGILPILSFENGKLVSIQKVHGLKQGMKTLGKIINDLTIDLSYPIIAAYTKAKENLKSFLSKIPNIIPNEEIELPPSLMTHWGQDALGISFVTL